VPVLLDSLAPLVAQLRADGYRVVGPTVRDDAIVLAELTNADELPAGWGVSTAPGSYRLRRRDDRFVFGHAAGPQSWKSYLHPARSPICTVDREPDGGFTMQTADDPASRYAFLGVRGCDLRAIAIQDRVLGRADSGYARRRAAAFVVAVDCTEPAQTCFCVPAGAGPRAGTGQDSQHPGYDLALTELEGADGAPRYLVRTGSAAGAALLAQLSTGEADGATVAQAEEQVEAAAHRMGRSLPETDVPQLLARTLDSPEWDNVAARCLSCGNCTMVCPTCFCTSVEDTSDLTGAHAQRWQRWASCFELDFSYLHGGPVRTTIRSRYRQWLTHKLGTWHVQFGESGCVGCGRCIVWCPVGIDITEEVEAIDALDRASRLVAPGGPAADTQEKEKR
jgi:sulfhydrogenase subunit beta (sulfur reductase)